MLRALLFLALLPLTCLAQSSAVPEVGGMPATVPGVFALQNATVVVGDGTVLENCTVILEDGLISAVGTDVKIPANAWEMDLSGKFVYPGFIDCLSEIGIARESGRPSARGQGNSREESAPSVPEGGMLAHVKALDLVDRESKDFEKWRNSGIATINIAPDRGIFMGQTAVVNLNGTDPKAMAIKPYAAARASFQSVGWNSYPGSLLGVVAVLRQTLLDARRYAELSDLYSRNQRGLRRPEHDRVLEALQPVIERNIPLILPGKTEREIRRAVNLAQEQKVQLIVAGGFEADRASTVLRQNDVSVLLSLNFPEKSKDLSPEAEEPLESMLVRHHAPRAAGLLEAAGVRFAFCSDGVKTSRDFMKNLRTAVKNGLSRETAIRALTLTAARILGVDEQLGSIETGKIANLVIADRDVFDDKARLTHVFVDGEMYQVPPDSENGKKGEESARKGKQEPAGSENPSEEISFSYQVPPGAPEKLITNANILTVTKGTLSNSAILVRNGKIIAVGADAKPGPNTEVIDAKGKWVMPGIVDAHNHIAADSINEGAVAVSSMTRMEDVLDPTDVNIYRDLAGGVTVAHVMHGSANPIGGQNSVIKLRWGKPIDQMVFKAGKPGLKFALGENPKRPGSSSGSSRRYPASRMGVEDVIRTAFLEAREYSRKWQEYEQKKAKGIQPLAPPRRDLKLEPIAEVLRGERMMHVHAYRADEMLMIMRLADEFGFKVTTFDHGLEGYKIAKEIAAHGATVTTFSDWWAYKVEAYDAIPYNAAVLVRNGVLVSINSDGAEESRHLFQEAAKCIKYGGLSENEALAMITINPAKQLRIDSRVGSIEVGKDADLVIFNGHPLSVYGVPDMVLIDGDLYYSRDHDARRQKAHEEVKKRLLQAESAKPSGGEKPEEQKKPADQPTPTEEVN